MSKETEYKYLATDDTVDIGKEPLLIESEELAEIMRKCIERNKKIVKSASNNG